MNLNKVDNTGQWAYTHFMDIWRRRYQVIFLILFLLGTVSACQSLQSLRQPAPITPPPEATASGIEKSWGEQSGDKLTILYSNTTNGVLKACGCPGNPYGGLPQRARMIKMLRQVDPDLLLFDSGDVLSALFQAGREKDVLKSDYIWQAYQEMAYDAIGIGDQDLNLGLEYLESAARKNQLPLLNATILKLPGNEPIAPGQRFFTRKRVSLGVTSVIGPQNFFFFTQKNILLGKMLISEPQKILAQQIPTFKKAVDLIVVLSHLGIDEDKKLAEAFPDIDLIVGGHTQTFLAEPVRVGKTLIVQAGGAGEHLGRLVLYLDRDKKIAGYNNILIPLNEQVPPDVEVEALVDKFYQMESEQLDVAPNGSVVYPAANCELCHVQEAQIWRATKHSRAYLSLQRSRREEQPECLICHTAGYGYQGGFPRSGTPQLAAVYCLSCHVFAIRDGKKINHLAETEKKKICLGCHTKEKSPAFNYETYWQQISH